MPFGTPRPSLHSQFFPPALPRLAVIRSDVVYGPARALFDAYRLGFVHGVAAGGSRGREAEEVPLGSGEVSMASICAEVARKHGIAVARMLGGERRDRGTIVCRQEAMWRCHAETGKSHSVIARMFKCDPTTIGFAVAAHQRRLQA